MTGFSTFFKSCFLSFLFCLNTKTRQITTMTRMKIMIIVRFKPKVIPEQPSSLARVIEVVSKENSFPSIRNSNSIAEFSGSATSFLREVKTLPHSSGIEL